MKIAKSIMNDTTAVERHTSIQPALNETTNRTRVGKRKRTASFSASSAMMLPILHHPVRDVSVAHETGRDEHPERRVHESGDEQERVQDHVPRLDDGFAHDRE